MSWKKTVQNIRNNYIKETKEYVLNVTPDLNTSEIKKIKLSLSEFILKIYNDSYKKYLIDEQLVTAEIMDHLLITTEAKNYIKNIAGPILNNIKSVSNEESTKDLIAQLLTTSMHRFSDQIYDFNLSTTNSRRSRSGKTFEIIIEHILRNIFEYPVVSQVLVGKSRWQKNNLKKVDFLLPNLETYRKNRTATILISTKTSLKERWEQIVSELVVSNVPQIYLCTIDKNLTTGMIGSIGEHNITLVVPKKQKEKFRGFANIIAFETFFNKTIPKLLS